MDILSAADRFRRVCRVALSSRRNPLQSAAFAHLLRSRSDSQPAHLMMTDK